MIIADLEIWWLYLEIEVLGGDCQDTDPVFVPQARTKLVHCFVPKLSSKKYWLRRIVVMIFNPCTVTLSSISNEKTARLSYSVALVSWPWNLYRGDIRENNNKRFRWIRLCKQEILSQEMYFKANLHSTLKMFRLIVIRKKIRRTQKLDQFLVFSLSFSLWSKDRPVNWPPIEHPTNRIA